MSEEICFPHLTKFFCKLFCLFSHRNVPHPYDNANS
jgi:hypothetical protein